MDYHDLLSGFVRVHVLHHAAEGEVYGQWMIEELARHGYRLSPGTLYPMLHSMEEKGYLASMRIRAAPEVADVGSMSQPTLAARRLVLRARLRELVGEVG